MPVPKYPYSIYTVGESIVGYAYIEEFIPEHQSGLGSPARYIHPLANSLLAGTLVEELINLEFDGKHIDPYKKK